MTNATLGEAKRARRFKDAGNIKWQVHDYPEPPGLYSNCQQVKATGTDLEILFGQVLIAEDKNVEAIPVASVMIPLAQLNGLIELLEKMKGQLVEIIGDLPEVPKIKAKRGKID